MRIERLYTAGRSANVSERYMIQLGINRNRVISGTTKKTAVYDGFRSAVAQCVARGLGMKLCITLTILMMSALPAVYAQGVISIIAGTVTCCKDADGPATSAYLQ